MAGPMVGLRAGSFSSLEEAFGHYKEQLKLNGEVVVLYNSHSPDGLADLIAQNLPSDGKRLIIVTKEPTTPRSLRPSGAAYDEIEVNGGVENPYAAVEAGLPAYLKGKLNYNSLSSIYLNGAGIVGRLEITVAQPQNRQV